MSQKLDNLVFLGVILIFFSLFIIIIGLVIFAEKEYKNSAYYQITKQSYFSVWWDKGKYGEFLTYKMLKGFEAGGARFLFNLYIPKENGQTTEIDLLMISSKGLFVFESKNYSGWIFGDECQKKWCQILPTGRRRSHREYFYNPIMQNRTHIKYLKVILGEQIPMWSIIVFSERCTIKELKIQSRDISVIRRDNVFSATAGRYNMIPENLLSAADITNIYNKLYPYTQVDATVRVQHIADIQNKVQAQSVRAAVTPVTPEDVNEQFKAVEQQTQIRENVLDEKATVEKTSLVKCPRCGGNLILRTAKKGVNIGKQFYGCSNYPKCKYIQNLAEDNATNQ